LRYSEGALGADIEDPIRGTMNYSAKNLDQIIDVGKLQWRLSSWQKREASADMPEERIATYWPNHERWAEHRNSAERALTPELFEDALRR